MKILEIIIVIVILTILLSIGLSAYYKFLDQQALNEASEGVVNIIQKARAYTLSSKGIDADAMEGACYGVEFNQDEQVTTLVDGEDNEVETFVLPSRTVFDSEIQFKKPAGGSGGCANNDNAKIYFQRLTGKVGIKEGGGGNACDSGSFKDLCETVGARNTITIWLKKNSESGPARVITILPTGVVQSTSQ